MIVYSDILTGDQVLSDTRKQVTLKHNGEDIPGVFTVQSKLVVKGPVSVNIGANASAEGGDEEVSDEAVKVNDLKDAELGFGYEGPQSYTEAEFLTLYKSWCKAMKEKIEAEGRKPKAFMQAAKAFHDFIKSNYSNMEV